MGLIDCSVQSCSSEEGVWGQRDTYLQAEGPQKFLLTFVRSGQEFIRAAIPLLLGRKPSEPRVPTVSMQVMHKAEVAHGGDN